MLLSLRNHRRMGIPWESLFTDSTVRERHFSPLNAGNSPKGYLSLGTGTFVEAWIEVSGLQKRRGITRATHDRAGCAEIAIRPAVVQSAEMRGVWGERELVISQLRSPFFVSAC